MAHVTKTFYFLKTSLANKKNVSKHEGRTVQQSDLHELPHLALTIPITTSDPSQKFYQQILTNMSSLYFASPIQPHFTEDQSC